MAEEETGEKLLEGRHQEDDDINTIQQTLSLPPQQARLPHGHHHGSHQHHHRSIFVSYPPLSPLLLRTQNEVGGGLRDSRRLSPIHRSPCRRDGVTLAPSRMSPTLSSTALNRFRTSCVSASPSTNAARPYALSCGSHVFMIRGGRVR